MRGNDNFGSKKVKRTKKWSFGGERRKHFVLNGYKKGAKNPMCGRPPGFPGVSPISQQSKKGQVERPNREMKSLVYPSRGRRNRGKRRSSYESFYISGEQSP